MNIQMFTIHDVKAGAYLPPFTLPTKQMAKRTFSDTVNDPKHPFHAHPEDYTLFHIGEFDDETGMVTNDEGKTAIANGIDLYIPIPDNTKVTQTQIDFINEMMNSHKNSTQEY